VGGGGGDADLFLDRDYALRYNLDSLVLLALSFRVFLVFRSLRTFIVRL
jgi:hypothetical protein